jgi:hypothetical protein
MTLDTYSHGRSSYSNGTIALWLKSTLLEFGTQNCQPADFNILSAKSLIVIRIYLLATSVLSSGNSP